MKSFPGRADVCLSALRAESLSGRIPEAQHHEWVEFALEDACALAARVGRDWGSEPFAIAAGCALPVAQSEAEAGYGSTVIYAEYAVRTRAITLYMPAIRRLDARLAVDCGPHLGVTQTAPIFLAHELYHHFDCLRGAGALLRRRRVSVLKLGRWSWTAGLNVLCEIAAGAFAQQLLGLRFHPRLFDVVLAQRSTG
jgi:hypothetical protein